MSAEPRHPVVPATDGAGGGAGTFASAELWGPDDLAAVLAHQLGAPLAVDLFDGLPTADRDRLSAAAADAAPPIADFRDLLLHAAPPAALLAAVRAFAGRPPTARRAGLPPAVARALDVAAAAAATRAGGGPVAACPPEDLAWLAGLSWADPALRRLADSALSTAATVVDRRAADGSAAKPPPTPAGFDAPPDFAPAIDGFRITGRLGEGGMGVVWRAVQLSTGRPVALKLMSAASFGSERARLRFEREVRLTARLDHPQLARVYDSGLHRGAYFYAMELVEGLPLDRYALGGKLDDRAVLALVRSTCAAVDHAHRRGIVHRDLKPANVLVDAAGVPHVLDFGLAKALQDVQASAAVTIDGDLAGTPAYMAPEQAAGTPGGCDARADVYALGVVLFHLLTGSFPHDVSGSRIEVLRRVGTDEPRSLADARPDADRALAAVLRRALARDPAERFATAGEFGDAIERHLAGGGGGRAATAAAAVTRGPVGRGWAGGAGSSLSSLISGVSRAIRLGLRRTAKASGPAPLPAVDGGPWIAGRVYGNPGRPFVVRLNPGTAAGAVQAWRVDWGTGGAAEELPGDARAVRHVYGTIGRFTVRVQALLADGWHAASTGSRPAVRWAAADGGNDNYYAATERRGTWARALDEAWSRGGGPVSINSAAEQAFLVRAFLADDAARREWFWIGLTERPLHRLVSRVGEYMWCDDSSYDSGYKNWAPGFPSDPTGTTSAAMNHALATGVPGAAVGQWSDLRDEAFAAPGSGGRGIIEFAGRPPDALLAAVTDGFAVPAEEEHDEGKSHSGGGRAAPVE